MKNKNKKSTNPLITVDQSCLLPYVSYCVYKIYSNKKLYKAAAVERIFMFSLIIFNIPTWN